MLLSVMPLGAAAVAQTRTSDGPGARPAIISAPPPMLPIAQVNQLPPCAAGQLLVSTDAEDGDFNGMSHAGTLIILRNHGTQVCRILPLAQASLLDQDGKPLGPFTTMTPHSFGMHPGPVVLPIALAVNAELTATLRWVSGPVFSDTLCLAPTTLRLELGSLILKTPLTSQLCGERAKGVSAELSRFSPDQIPVATSRQ